MTCKGICLQYKAKKKPIANGRYFHGQKRCQVCEEFLEWDGLWCPCCGYRLRTKPRSSKYKARLKERQNEAKITGETISNKKEMIYDGKGSYILKEIS